MGREKRIARAGQGHDDKRTKAPEGAGSNRARGDGTTTAPAAKATTSTGKALFQILLLYALPIVLIILIGKLVFKL